MWCRKTIEKNIMEIKLAKCGHVWFHNDCETCIGIREECEKEFQNRKGESS